MDPTRRYVSLLQIGGTLAVIGFHVELRGSSWGWLAVILFFALAGRNMARTADSSESLFNYAASRIRRLAPELTIVWCLVALVALSGVGTRGAGWFLLSSPVFLQNLTLPLFQYRFPADWLFGPLWFVAALLQLQLIVYSFRRVIVTRPTWAVVVAAVAVGTVFRWLAALVLAGNGAAIDDRVGNILYCLPLTHIEAITLGFLVGRGSLVGLGRQLPVVASLALALSLLNGTLSGQPIESLGLDFPMHTNYMHVWGYALFAFAAASLCSPHNPIAIRLRSMSIQPRLDAALSRIASLTFGAYVFHGPVMAVLTTPVEPFRQLGTRPVRFLVVVVGAFLLAEAALSARRAMEVGTQRVFKRLA